MLRNVTHRLGAACILAALLLLLWLLTPLRNEQVVLAPQDDSSLLRFGRDRTVGQEFVPPRGLSAISITVGAHESPTGPLLLHLRTDYLGEDLRSATVFTMDEGTTDIRFAFRPLLNPPPRLLWVLEAPYNPGNVWVYRERDATAFPEGAALSNNRPLAGNFGFTATSYELRLQRLWRTIGQAAPAWEKQSLLVGGLSAAIVLAAAGRRRWLSVPHEVWWLMAASFIAHLIFIRHFPVINDEGAYIQDIVQSNGSFIPLRDFLTKGPLYLLMLKAWQLIAPHTVLGWRLFSATLWSLGIYFSVALAGQLRLPPITQRLIGLLMALLPATIALTTPLLLQIAAVPVGLAALYAVMRGLRDERRSLIILAGCLMTAAYLIRVSSAVMAVVGLLLILIYSRRRWPTAAWYVGAGLVSFAAACLLLFALLGWPQTAVALNIEAWVIARGRAENLAPAAEPLIRQLVFQAQTLWRSAPLLLAGLMLVPVLAAGRKLAGTAVAAVILVPVLLLTWRHWSDMNYLLPAQLPITQLTIATLVFGLPLVWLTVHRLLPAPQFLNDRSSLKLLGVFAMWLALLALAYGQWGRFRQSYLVEFVVPLTFITAWSLTVMQASWRRLPSRSWRQAGAAALVFLISASVFQGAVIAYQQPQSGNISQASLAQIVAATRASVPVGQALFTAQPAVTAFAERPIIFGYSHPGWYREERFGTVPRALRAVYFMDPPALTEHLRLEAQFVLMERRTHEIYFDGYPERSEILEQRFQEIARVDNPDIGEPFILYERQ